LSGKEDLSVSIDKIEHFSEGAADKLLNASQPNGSQCKFDDPGLNEPCCHDTRVRSYRNQILHHTGK
jgi:hypothetical protein